uniref:Uncharacterized protein n=1 Tax=Anguilla anguilla TaxID=7936 RepID=A0A0E9REB3_ANGAN
MYICTCVYRSIGKLIICKNLKHLGQLCQLCLH